MTGLLYPRRLCRLALFASPGVIPRRLADEGSRSRNALFAYEIPQSLSLHRDDS
jgi:hypothetical protein